MEANNVAAMREALCEIVLLTVKAGKSISCDVACGIIASKAKHALKRPPRNCDRFGFYEQAKSEWWKTEVLPRVDGVVRGAEKPFNEWLFATATKQKGENNGSK